MTAKEYLRQVKTLDIKINQRIQERDELRERAMGSAALSSDGERVQTSVGGDRMGELIGRYVDMEAEIDKMIDEMVDLKHRIIGEIHQLTDSRYVELLYLRYIRFMRLEEIACTMKKSNGDYYSYDHIKRLHGEALKKFENDVEMPPFDVLL